MQIIGWDLGSHLCGWAVTDCERLPVAGAFELDRCTPETIGDMGAQFSRCVMEIHGRFPGSTHWVSERPLLTPTDLRFTLERLYGLSMLLQTIGRKLGLQCAMVEPGTAKAEWAGRNASKDEMIAIAVRMGIQLPKAKANGREDAADACAVAKVGVRLFARQHLMRWDQAVYRRQGGLI
jgi:hypothetical protein